jgi:hypothetical protein
MSDQLPKSKITGGGVELVFTAKLLGKHDVRYYRCLETGFIQTEEPYWLAEAYAAAITASDVGAVKRSIHFSKVMAAVISRFFNPDKRFLDFGGGSGLMVRLMRDEGYDFWRYDPYCQNLFAAYFDFDPSAARGNQEMFELVTAFEVFEHAVDPIGDIARMFEWTDSIFFTTELQPKDKVIRSAEDWHYFCPEHGQHISFHTIKSLAYIAKHFGAVLHSDLFAGHLLTKRRTIPPIFQNNLPTAPARATLQQKDAETVLAKMREGVASKR